MPRTPTTTQIRNFYDNKRCYLNLSFYNNSLSIKFSPYQGTDQGGRDRYDTQNGITTTLSYDKVFALYELTKNIVDRKIQGCKLELDCNGGKLTFVYNGGGNVPVLSIDKNGKKAEFRFETMPAEVMVNGQKESRILNTQLGVFMKTMDGFLSGINADRHLNKLTENYVASLTQDGNNNSSQRGGGYQNKGGYNNRGNNYQRNNYNNSGGYNKNSAKNPAPQVPATELDNYELPF